MATYFALLIPVHTTATTLSSVTNWTSMRPTYLTYSGNSSAVSLDTSNWASTLYSETDGEYPDTQKYAVYVYDMTSTHGQQIENIRNNHGSDYGMWVHNDSTAPTASSYVTNANNGGWVFPYDSDSPASFSCTLNGSTISVNCGWYFFKYWNNWINDDDNYDQKVTNYHPNPAYRSRISMPSGGTTIVEMTHVPGTYGTSGKIGLISTSTTITYSMEAAYGSDLFDFSTMARTTSSNTAKTTTTYPNRTFGVHNVNAAGNTYNVGYFGGINNNNIYSSPSYGYYVSSYASMNNWASLTSKYSSNVSYYSITQNSSGAGTLILQQISVSRGFQYVFNMYTYSEASYDGVMLSETTLTNQSSGTISSKYPNLLGSCTGQGITGSVTYTAHQNKTIYMYYRSDGSGFGDSSTSSADVKVIKNSVTLYTVTLNKAGGSGGTSTIYMLYGDTASDYPSITVPSKSGFSFLGYFDSSSGGTQYISSTGAGVRTWDKTSNTTLYAQWGTASIPITIQGNGGTIGTGTSTSTVMGVTPNASTWSIATSQIPQRSGFTLYGFYNTISNNASAGYKYANADGTSYRSAPSLSLTIYAHWLPNITYSPVSTASAYVTSSAVVASSTLDDLQINVATVAGSVPSGVASLTYGEGNENWDVTTDGKAIIVPEGTGYGTYELEITAAVQPPYVSSNYRANSVDKTIAVTLMSNQLLSTKYKNTSGTTGSNFVPGTPTVTFISTSLRANGGYLRADCSCSNQYTWYQKYSNGTYTSLQSSNVSGSAYLQMTSNGNNRFTIDTGIGGGASPSTLSGVTGSVYPSGTYYDHSNMTTNVGTDTIVITAYNASSVAKTGTGSVSVSNNLESLSISGASATISVGASTTASVFASYTSGSTEDITDSLSVTATSGSNRINSGNTNIVTISNT